MNRIIKKFIKLETIDKLAIIAYPFEILLASIMVQCYEFLRLDSLINKCMIAVVIAVLSMGISGLVYSLLQIIANIITKTQHIQ